MSDLVAIDLFAGPGGWDVGCVPLGIEPLGIELDPTACRTREAAGLRTLQADVAQLSPAEVLKHLVGRGSQRLDLLIASPPCPTFSAAGGRAGAGLMEVITACTMDLIRGRDTREAAREEAYTILKGNDTDAKKLVKARREANLSLLVVEPMRWVLDLKPEMVAWEQVPPVLDYWKFCAGILRELGYNTWAGVLSAERYGVPQTRKRAILMGSNANAVQPPQPTHQEYVSGEPAFTEPELTLEGELFPWISMAEALGWRDDGHVEYRRGGERIEEGFGTGEPSQTLTSRADRWQVEFPERWKGVDVPAPTVTSGGTETGGAEIFAGGGAPPNQSGRRRVGFPRKADDGAATEDGYRERDFRDADEPAFALTEKARSMTIHDEEPEEKEKRQLRNNTSENAAVREEDDPAPTMYFGERLNKMEWEVVETGNTKGGTRPEGLSRSGDEPSRTIDSRADQMERRQVDDERAESELADKPAPTVVGTRRSQGGGIIGRQLPPGEGEENGGWKFRNGNQENAAVREGEEPAPTVAFGNNASNVEWVDGRPATTVAGDPRIAQPGHKKDEDNPDSPGRMENAVRVSVGEAARLQGFPWEYPWQGSNTAQFQQIGNAVPPQLAHAVIAALVEARNG